MILYNPNMQNKNRIDELEINIGGYNQGDTLYRIETQ